MTQPQPIVRNTVEAGAFARNALRVQLDLLGVAWIEHKGWLGSTFVITATPEKWRAIRTWIKRRNADNPEGD